MTGKEFIKELLTLAQYKVDNDECTDEDLLSLAKLLSKELHVGVSVNTLAKMYNQSPNNVSNVISRHLIPKGTRRNVVLYNFSWFLKVIPSSWIRQHK